MEKDKNPYLALRIQVESGGCHGFQYLMSLTTLPPSLQSGTTATPPSSQATAEAGETSTTTDTAASEPGVGEEDTVFAFVKEGDDLSANQQGDVGSLAAGPKIVLDAPSLELLKGSKVDYTMELIGSQFKIVDNPLASSSCGCGTSFDIKV